MLVTKTIYINLHSQPFLLMSEQHELHDFYHSSDSCLLTNQETLGLSSMLAVVIGIESLVIVILLTIIIKANRCQKLPPAQKIEVSSN